MRPQTNPIEFTFPRHPDYVFAVNTVRWVHKLLDKNYDDFEDAEVSFVGMGINKPGKYGITMEVYFGGYYYSADEWADSLIITKLDTINHIISGQFYGNVLDNYSYSTYLNITNGRFDFNLKLEKR